MRAAPRSEPSGPLSLSRSSPHRFARFLYDLLTNDQVNRRKIPVLVFENMTDLLTCCDLDVLKEKLTLEM